MAIPSLKSLWIIFFYFAKLGLIITFYTEHVANAYANFLQQLKIFC